MHLITWWRIFHVIQNRKLAANVHSFHLKSKPSEYLKPELRENVKVRAALFVQLADALPSK